MAEKALWGECLALSSRHSDLLPLRHQMAPVRMQRTRSSDKRLIPPSTSADDTDFIEKNSPKWDAATVNPPLVLGEVLQQVESADKLNTSVGKSPRPAPRAFSRVNPPNRDLTDRVAMVYQWAAGEKKEDDLPGQLGNWVNVNQGKSRPHPPRRCCYIHTDMNSRRDARPRARSTRSRRRAIHLQRGLPDRARRRGCMFSN
jgi:hypothetical protein